MKARQVAGLHIKLFKLFTVFAWRLPVKGSNSYTLTESLYAHKSTHKPPFRTRKHPGL